MSKNKTSSFSKRVINVVHRIPAGSVLTYKEVARRAGNERAYRAVGSVMRKNTDLSVPCHRVIKSDGSLGKYSGLRGEKSAILAQEGYLKK